MDDAGGATTAGDITHNQVYIVINHLLKLIIYFLSVGEVNRVRNQQASQYSPQQGPQYPPQQGPQYPPQQGPQYPPQQGPQYPPQQGPQYPAQPMDPAGMIGGVIGGLMNQMYRR